MPNTRAYYRSFGGGEISPEMFGRIDDAKFQTGAATVRNFIVRPTGAAQNRPGFAFVNATKNSGVARLLPFTFNLDQTMVIEMGAGYFRFYTMGQTLLGSGRYFLQSAICTISIGTPGVVTRSRHDFANGDSVVFGAGGFGQSLPGGITAGTVYYVINSSPSAGTFEVSATPFGSPITTTGSGTSTCNLYGYYNVGDTVVGTINPPGLGQLPYTATFVCQMAEFNQPLSNPFYWRLSTTGTVYEVANPYAEEDLFDIHYTQSMDVMTLVHPNYPPAELRRVSAASWTYSAIAFGPPLATPAGVAVAASPGFLAQISTISLANPALITTKSNHTLSLGDGIYIANLTATIGGVPTVLDGFYMVNNVPVDGSGNLIPNELTVMDYNGNVLDSSGWSSYAATDGTKPITIQFGDKIFNITSFYEVQAIASDGVSTSALSSSGANALNNLDVPGSYNTITWGAVAGAQSYNVYKQLNGLWGFIGNTQALTFADNNIAPDMGITPGIADTVFASPGNYPGAVCYFQQRRCFAGTNNAPNNAWMSNSGTEEMFSYSLPSQATDRIAFRVAALKADLIQHLIPMLQLILLTSESEFALGEYLQPVTPSNLTVNPQSYIGASNVQPTIINTTMVYAAARGGHVRELGYAWTVNGYMTGDLSLRAAHLFDDLTIADQAYGKSPQPIVWFVSSNGKLLGLTYIPDEQIGAWHQHDTEGTFESIACVAEGGDDALYAIVNRTVNGQTVRYVERMASQVIDESDPSTWFFVDAGITQSFSSPVSTVGGLTWLEGCTVAVLADGGTQAQKVVSGGAITLDHAASVVTVGLPYTSDLETLPAVLQLDGYGQGRRKNIGRAWVKVYQSSGILVGPDEDHLTEIKQRTTEPWGSPPALQTSELEVLNTPSWQDEGQALIRQVNPLPLTVAGLTLEVTVGG